MSYTFIDTKDKLLELSLAVRSNTSNLYLDIESTGLNWVSDQILLFQMMKDDEIYIVDVRGLGYDLFSDLILSIKESGSCCIFHNAKFDMKFIYRRSAVLLNNIYDTMTAEIVLNAGKGKNLYNLAELSEKYADIFMDKETRKSFIDYPEDAPFTDLMLNYSALDVKVLEPIYKSQLEQFEETKQVKVMELEMGLLPIVAKMEINGIRLDTEKWLEVEKEAIILRDQLIEEFNKDILEFLTSRKEKNALLLVQKYHLLPKGKFTKKMVAMLEEITDLKNLRSWLEERFNVKSPLQLKAILNGMGVRCKNTNEKTLENFKNHAIVGKLLKIRKVNKQIDQYGSNFLKSINPVTGKIHTEYFTVGTQTGRFSSNNPNLQNVPRKGGYRECFLPEEGYVFAIVDYSQQEYRLAGAVSREPVIIEAYKNGSDMHTATGKLVAKKDEITSEERVRGKSVNFAILYGSTEFGLKRNLKIDIDEAVEIKNAFWEGYPRLAKFMERAGEMILSVGYSCTPIGRRRYNIEKPTFGNSDIITRWQERVLREGRNHIIQGGGADILKMAMLEIDRRNPFGDYLRLCLQIHDELVAQVHTSVKEEALEFIKSVMREVEQTFLGEIPAEVDGALKERWSK